MAGLALPAGLLSPASRPVASGKGPDDPGGYPDEETAVLGRLDQDSQLGLATSYNNKAWWAVASLRRYAVAEEGQTAPFFRPGRTRD
jgi:hypothetical protein